MRILLHAVVASLALLLATPGHAFFGFGKKKAQKSVQFVVEMNLSGSYPDRQGNASLFGEKKSYPKLLKRLNQIRKDKRVKALVVRFGGLAVGFAKAEGIRHALQNVAKSGKQTIAILEAASTVDYLAAMGCKRIAMTPAGMLYMPGLRAEKWYFKNLLEKVGLAADFITVGNFKTAPEPFMRSTMSDAQRKQLNRLLGDLYQYMVEEISKGRKLDLDNVKAAVDRGMMLPAVAKQVGLIDEIAYSHALRKRLLKLIPQRPLRFVSDYGKVKRKQPNSIWTLFSWFFRRRKDKLDPTKPKIAVIYASGNISYGSASGGFGGNNDGIYSNDLIKTLEKVRKVKNLRAVVLRVNSPGGSALASDLIWRKLEQLKKRVPLFVSMGNVAASGGYYIAMGADMIVAQPTTITGSIGVFGGKIVMSGALNKLGINVQSVSLGKHSGIMSMSSKFSASERVTMKALLAQIYSIFTTKAAKGRKMKHADLLKLAGGQVWTGRQALKSKLVDKLGSLQDTINWAIKRTGLKMRPQIVNYPRPKSFFEALQTMSMAKTNQPKRASMGAFGPMLQVLNKLAPAYTRQLMPLFSSKMPVLMYTPVPRILLR